MSKPNLLILIFLLGLAGCRNLPKGIGYKGEPVETTDVEFLYDLTYEKKGISYSEHRIFPTVRKVIEDAEAFLIIDVFLFNELANEGDKFPHVTQKIADALIQKKRSNPKIKIYFITDEINNFYGAYQGEELKRLEDAGIKIIITNLSNMNGANEVYSGVWKTVFSWFGTRGYGWLPNPFGSKAPKVTLRAYLKLLNIKGNHRKIVISEKEGILTSANPHSASGYHSNIGFKIKGAILKEFLDSEESVAKLSNVNFDVKLNPPKNNAGKYKVELLTEGAIGKAIDQDLEYTKKGDRIYIGMFYLGDKKIIRRLIKASRRGVKVNIILDQNKEAFGMKKTGIPNRVTARRMEEKTNSKIKIKWYNTKGEQYHTKLLFIKKKNTCIINGGSANMTKRNMRNYTLDANLRIEAPKNSKLSKDVEEYFKRVWGNDGGEYTLKPQNLEKGWITNKILYEIQMLSGFTTF